MPRMTTNDAIQFSFGLYFVTFMIALACVL